MLIRIIISTHEILEIWISETLKKTSIFWKIYVVSSKGLNPRLIRVEMTISSTIIDCFCAENEFLRSNCLLLMDFSKQLTNVVYYYVLFFRYN